MVGRRIGRLVAATLLVLLGVHGVQASTAYSQTIYRATAFATQKTDSLCTGAVVQNIRNLATGESRTSKAQQAALYAFGRAHNRYAYRQRGVDPQGVEAMLEQFVPGIDWQQVRKRSLQEVLRAAARGMRTTGLPAVLFVAGGRHVWTMNGYTVTADPASSGAFRVTYVRFSGPFYPHQKARYGWFDLAPNSRRSVDRLTQAYFPYRERLAFGDGRSTPWNGYYVAVIPAAFDDVPPPGTSPSPTTTVPPGATPQATPATTPETTLLPTPGPTTVTEPAQLPEVTAEPTASPAQS
jgi:hypothetical protein